MTVDLTPGVDTRLAFLDTADQEAARPEIVGAKAANLMRMATAGLPVPPGFVIGTEVCAAYHAGGLGLDADVIALIERGVRHVEDATGLSFGASRRPLLVAVRSGAARSMPGMLDTILNVGLCDATVPGLLRATGDPVFVWDSYRRLIQSHAEVVAGCPSSLFVEAIDGALDRCGVPTLAELDVAGLRALVDDFESIYRSSAGVPFPQDPMEQLRDSVEAVFRSWNSDRAVEYRRLEGLTDLVGTAVTVQAMVFGNQGVTSGSGVGFTRDPATGENRLYVDFLLNAQGEDVVGGRSATSDPGPLIAAVPGLAHQLQTAPAHPRVDLRRRAGLRVHGRGRQAVGSSVTFRKAHAVGRVADRMRSRRRRSARPGCGARTHRLARCRSHQSNAVGHALCA